jgi:hypothetical protein
MPREMAPDEEELLVRVVAERVIAETDVPGW